MKTRVNLSTAPIPEPAFFFSIKKEAEKEPFSQTFCVFQCSIQEKTHKKQEQ
ncbi:MAG: hypothetical protein RBS73_01065 [Prolixibacteraceae bacterium]|jgi:hypothetical protein|nr:hypothetical protein [Prolixibacteraceae bacterium]